MLIQVTPKSTDILFVRKHAIRAFVLDSPGILASYKALVVRLTEQDL